LATRPPNICAAAAVAAADPGNVGEGQEENAKNVKTGVFFLA